VSGSQRPDIRNERAKLLADLLNTVASSTIVAGVVAPIAAALVFAQSGFRPGAAIFGIFLWTGIGIILHVGGRTILGELRRDG
jgi:hypothetical protein